MVLRFLLKQSLQYTGRSPLGRKRNSGFYAALGAFNLEHLTRSRRKTAALLGSARGPA